MLKNILAGLIIWLISTSSAFSQVDTTVVTLPVSTVRLVIKDLIKGDTVTKENYLLNQKIILMERRIETSDKTIAGQDSLILSYKKIGDLKTQQITTYRTVVEKLEKDIAKTKAQRNRLLKVSIGLAAGLGLSIFL